MAMLIEFVLLCSMTTLTIGAAVEPRLVGESLSCPCGWTEFQDRCFIYVPEAMTWSEAQTNCQSMKANLASVRSFEEYTAMQSLTAFDDYRSAWIGGSDAQQERFWFWIDGTPFTYTNWCVYQPDHRGGGPYCLHMNYGAGKCWDDAECHAPFPSICAKKILG